MSQGLLGRQKKLLMVYSLRFQGLPDLIAYRQHQVSRDKFEMAVSLTKPNQPLMNELDFQVLVSSLKYDLLARSVMCH